MPPDTSSATAAAGTPAHDDDAAVIARSLSDPEQFAVLFRRHAPAIQRYVTRRIGPQPADDVVAETFLIAFRHRAGYRLDSRGCLPWLYGIATNLVGRHRRKEVAYLRLLARTGADPVTEPFTDQVDAAVTAGSAKMRLAAALASLPAAQRDALLLVAWAGLTYHQAALATGAPLGTVQSRVNRARRRLRQQLADLDPAASEHMERLDRPAGTERRRAGFAGRPASPFSLPAEGDLR